MAEGNSNIIGCFLAKRVIGIRDGKGEEGTNKRGRNMASRGVRKTGEKKSFSPFGWIPAVIRASQHESQKSTQSRHTTLIWLPKQSKKVNEEK